MITQDRNLATMEHIRTIADAADPFLRLWERIADEMPPQPPEAPLQFYCVPCGILTLNHLKALYEAIIAVAEDMMRQIELDRANTHQRSGAANAE